MHLHKGASLFFQNPNVSHPLEEIETPSCLVSYLRFVSGPVCCVHFHVGKKCLLSGGGSRNPRPWSDMAFLRTTSPGLSSSCGTVSALISVPLLPSRKDRWPELHCHLGAGLYESLRIQTLWFHLWKKIQVDGKDSNNA